MKTYSSPPARLPIPSSLILTAALLTGGFARAEPPPTCAGSLDPSFSAGTGVRTAKPSGYATELESLLVEPNGDVLIYGSFWLVQGQPRRGLARLRPDGSLDPAFAPELHGTVVRAVARRPDGHLLVGGDFTAVGNQGHRHLVVLHPNGSPDWSFSPESGIEIGEVHALALDPEGRVLVAGTGMATWESKDLVLLRLTATGNLDRSFNVTNGLSGVVRAVALQPAGQILLAGTTSELLSGARLLLARIEPDGTPDASFVAALDPLGSATSVACDAERRILVGGVLRTASGTQALGLVRLATNGALDPAFDSEVRLGGDCDVRAFAVQPDGCILVGGRFDQLNQTAQTLVARVNPDGSLDPSFTPSLYKYPETGEGEFVSGLALQPDGRVLVTGYLTLANGRTINSVARLHTDCCDCAALVALTAPAFWAEETAGVAEVTVRRVGNLDRPAAVGYTVSPYPYQPPGTAIPGAEFAAASGTLVFGPGQALETLRVPIYDDQVAEPSERFMVDLHLLNDVPADQAPDRANPANGVTLGRVTQAVVTIIDNETAGVAGSVDRAFHPDIKVADLGIGVSHIVPTPDGDLILAGAITRVNGLPRRGLARLAKMETLDPGFAPQVDGLVKAVAPADLGRLLVGGDFTAVNGVEVRFLARLNADGSMDATFRPGLDGEVLALAVLPDGRCLVGGEFQQVNGESRPGLVRLTSEGAVDPGFDAGTGPRFSDGPGFVRRLVLEPDGRVLVGGVFTHFNGVRRQHLARLEADGAVDAGFDPEATRHSSGFYDLARQPDGRILVVGHHSWNGERALVRLEPDGSTDAGFSTEQSYLYINTVALEPDGHILIGGSFQDPPGGRSVGLARLNPDGTTDRTFHVGDGFGSGIAIAIQVLPDGAILVGGNFDTANGLPHAYLTRLNGDPGGIAPFVTREVEGFTVRLRAAPLANVTTYTVEDQPPSGPAVNLSHGGTFDPATGRVRFGPFTDLEPRTLTYSVVVPLGECLRPARFEGFVAANGRQLPIVGYPLLGLDRVFPADLGPTDGRISPAEAGAFAAAWRLNGRWANEVRLIPIEEVTRAVTLELGQDAYAYDAQGDPAVPMLRWLSFGAPFPACLRMPAALPTGTAIREAPSGYVPGRPLRVVLRVTPAETVGAYAVEERVPWGWVQAIGEGGAYDEWKSVIKWGPFRDPGPRTLVYDLAPPRDAWPRDWTFAGTACFDGVNVVVTGAAGLESVCRLEAIREAPALGRVWFVLEGAVGGRYLIEASPDLRTWEELLTVDAPDGTAAFGDPAGAHATARFYRARALR